MKSILLALLTLLACSADAQTNVITPNPPIKYGTGGSIKFCDGQYHSYSCYVIYSKSAQQGWGWTTNHAPCIAFVGTNQNSTTNIIVYNGEFGDSGCGVNGTVTMPFPLYSPAYRFVVYRTDGVTNLATITNQPVTLIGFNP